MRAKVADDEQTTAHAPPQSLNGSGLPYSPTKSVEILFPLAARQAHPRLAARQAPPVHAAAPHRGLRGGGRLVTPVPGTESGQGGGDATPVGVRPPRGARPLHTGACRRQTSRTGPQVYTSFLDKETTKKIHQRAQGVCRVLPPSYPPARQAGGGTKQCPTRAAACALRRRHATATLPCPHPISTA